MSRKMGVIEDKYEDVKPDMPSYTLDLQDIEFCRRHARKRARSYFKNSVTDASYEELVISHTVGLMGEAAVALHYGEPIDVTVYEYGDAGYDLEIDGQTVDVKTRRKGKKEIVVSERAVKADAYVLCSIDSDTTVTLVGFIEKDDLLDREPQYYRDGSLKYIVHWSELERIPKRD